VLDGERRTVCTLGQLLGEPVRRPPPEFVERDNPVDGLARRHPHQRRRRAGPDPQPEAERDVLGVEVRGVGARSHHEHPTPAVVGDPPDEHGSRVGKVDERAPTILLVGRDLDPVHPRPEVSRDRPPHVLRVHNDPH
jgi:hypothetical protein